VRTEPDLAYPLPRLENAVTVVEAPGAGPGYWAGGPSAVRADGVYYLAYRLRRPVGEGRGYANVVARSDDGEHFETIAVLERDAFDAASLERPALVRRPDGGWRIYVSCATPDSLHWRVDAVDADAPDAFDAATRRTVLAGSREVAMKDPVVQWHDGRWHIWVCCHPIADAANGDRMYTRYGSSADGVAWDLQGVALEGRAGAWDQRGTRIADVLLGDQGVVAYYDGRATAEQNQEELTGVAVGEAPGALLHAIDDAPALESQGTLGGLRYMCAVPLGDGAFRFYYEITRSDGGHDLRTEYSPAPWSPSQSA